MKYVILVANILIGLVFVVFGLNYFLHFIPMPPMVEGSPAASFFGGIYPTNFLMVVKVIEIVCGAMILLNFQRPLAYLLIAPIAVGILLFELLISKQPGIGVAIVGLLALLIYSNRDKYMGILS